MESHQGVYILAHSRHYRWIMHVASQTPSKMLLPSSCCLRAPLPNVRTHLPPFWRQVDGGFTPEARKKRRMGGSFDGNIQRRNGMQTDEPKRKPRDVPCRGIRVAFASVHLACACETRVSWALNFHDPNGERSPARRWKSSSAVVLEFYWFCVRFLGHRRWIVANRAEEFVFANPRNVYHRATVERTKL